jgi:hypothetical protein
MPMHLTRTDGHCTYLGSVDLCMCSNPGPGRCSGGWCMMVESLWVFRVWVIDQPCCQDALESHSLQRKDLRM